MKIEYHFPPLNGSNSFGTVDYDAHINATMDYFLNCSFSSKTIAELNTLHHICELERTLFQTILAMSVKNPQLAGYLLNGIRSNLLYVEDSTTWTHDCPHFLPPVYEPDKCFDPIRIYYKNTVVYFDP